MTNVTKIRNAIMDPVSDILYASLREGVYVLCSVSNDADGAGLQMMAGLLAQQGVMVERITPKLCGGHDWADVSILRAKKYVADARDRGAGVIVISVSVYDLDNPFVHGMQADGLLFDQYCFLQSQSEASIDSFQRFLTRFYTTQRGQKMIIFPKANKVIYENVQNNPCEKSFSYGVDVDASFVGSFSPGSVRRSILGAQHTSSIPHIPSVFFPSVVMAFAGLYGFAGDVSPILAATQYLDIAKTIGVTSGFFGGRDCLWGAISYLYQLFSATISQTIICISPAQLNFFLRLSTTAPLPAKIIICPASYDPSTQPMEKIPAEWGARYLPFASREYAILYIKSVLSSSPCIFDSLEMSQEDMRRLSV